MSKHQNLNSNSFVGLDLSLSGSQINPVNSNGNTNNVKKTTFSRPTSAASTRSYIIQRTNSQDNLSKRPDSSRSERAPLNNSIKVRSSRQQVSTSVIPSRNDVLKSKDSVNISPKDYVFKQLTSRSSIEDNSASVNPNNQSKDNKENQMFILDEFLNANNSNNNRNNIGTNNESIRPSMMIYKDSLDVDASQYIDKRPSESRTLNTIANSQTDEAWQNEMLIYEKYLKEDLENFDFNKHEKLQAEIIEMESHMNENLRQDLKSSNEKPPKSVKSEEINSGSKAKSHKMTTFNNCIQQKNNKEKSNDKIEKLQSSVDSLRRSLHNDAQEFEKYNSNRLAEIRRAISARKIQRWYKRHNLRHKSGDAALKRLMTQKKEEIVNREKQEQENQLKAVLTENQKKEERASKIRQQRIQVLYKKKEEAKQNESLNESKTPKSTRSVTKTHITPSPRPVVREKTSQSIKSSQSNSIKTEPLINSTKSFTKESKDIHDARDEIKSEQSGKSRTIDDLLEAVKELEKVDKFPSPPPTVEESFASESTVTLQNEKSNSKKNPINDIKSTASISTQKLDSILSFLDDVESENKKQQQITTETNRRHKTENLNVSTNVVKQKPLINNFFEQESPNEFENKQSFRSSSSTGSKIKIAPPIVPSAEEIEDLEKATQAAAEVTNTMLAQRLELEEKKRTVSMLQKALNQQRELTVRHAKETEKEMQSRLDIQKQEYESTIQRHLGFIDQLIDDKKTLSEKCEKLVKELKDVDKKYTDRIRTLEDSFKVELQKLRDIHEAAEKIRREKWIEEKTKKIKEMTVKGLEPEIQNLIAKHKNEIKTIKSIHEAELLQSDERAAQRYIKMTEELRVNFEREKEAAVNRERELAKTRYEKCIEDEEKSYLEQRRRLYTEVEEEKNRVAEQALKQRQELDRLRKNLEENNFNAIEAMKREYETARNEQERRHQLETKELKEKLEIEKQAWEENYMKKQDNILAQKERELKENIRRERDKDIEMVISRLESETTLSREESERAADNRVKRIRDKYESELREVEKSERETTERYNTLKAKYNELEGEYERLKVVVRQKEQELEDIHKITGTLQQERARLADIIRQEFSDRIVFTEEESKRIKLEMAEVKSKHQYEIDKKKEEIEKLQREKEEELTKVHDRIKQAISKKEETVNQLRQQYDAACKRADHLEGLLEQQRKLMMTKK